MKQFYVLGFSSRARSKSRSHRGVALLMALFALGVAATAGTSFAKSRDHSVIVGRSMGEAARARLAAAEGLAISREVLANIFQQPDVTLATQWRAQLADGVL
jgi:type II secretory pathway component PulK